VVNTATMLTAVRKDRTTFMDQVAVTVQRATPSSPTGEAIADTALSSMLCSCRIFRPLRGVRTNLYT